MSKLKRTLVLLSPENEKSAKSKPTSEESEEQIFLDWTKCYLCQKDTSEKLWCPLDSCKAGTIGSETYQKISEGINAFGDLGCIPFNINVKLFHDGPGMG